MRYSILGLVALMLSASLLKADVVVMQTTATRNSTNTGGAAWSFTAASNAGFGFIWLGSQATNPTSGSFTFQVSDGSTTYTKTTTGALESGYLGLGAGYLFDITGGSSSGAGSIDIQNLAAGNYTFTITNTNNYAINSFSSSPTISTYQGFSSASFSGGNYQFALTAVPEPGTLLLGGIAACSGAAGAWWKRRKRKATQPETTDQPASA